MLRVGVSIVALAAWMAVMPLARPAADGQLAKLTIKGSFTYEAGGALPSDSRAVVELRHTPALPAAPAVAEQRIGLEGKTAPVSFDIAVERRKLVGGATYFVRVGILSGTRAIWTSDDVKIDVTASVADVGAITLKPAK
jgi:uncharacterized lipoprotein YbaY